MKPTEPRNPITEAELREVVAKLQAANQPITHRTVRAALGRGSFSTIGRMLLEMRAAATHSAQDPGVQELFTELWGAACARAKMELAKDLDALRTGLEEAITEAGRLEGLLEKAAQDLAEAHAKRDQLAGDLSRSMEEASSARTAAMKDAAAAAKALAELSQAQGELIAERRSREILSQEASARVTVLEREASARISGLQAELDATRAEAAKLVANSASLSERLTGAERDRQADSARHEEEKARLRAELAQALAKIEDLRSESDRRVAETQTRLEAALRTQVEMAEAHRREIAALLPRKEG